MTAKTKTAQKVFVFGEAGKAPFFTPMGLCIFRPPKSVFLFCHIDSGEIAG
jgi:hypothetical protein